jgi:hypothetical protein
MRALIRQAILADAELISLGVTPEATLAGDIDTPGPRPFVNLKWGTTVPGLGVVDRNTLVIWVHDNPNDYTLINKVCAALRRTLTGLEGTYDAVEGGWIQVVDWVSFGDELSDEGHGTITRTATFVITGN